MPYAPPKHRPPGWRPAVKRTDPFYGSALWKRLRTAVRQRDRGICQECRNPGWIVDHIIARKDGGPDEMSNLRTLCAVCDNRRHPEKASWQTRGV
jgi:5-methylcytosine-specific restriction enzyme A